MSSRMPDPFTSTTSIGLVFGATIRPSFADDVSIRCPRIFSTSV